VADEPELLREVLAKPDADGPRLAYAQWCEGQADPALVARARFIEAELTLVHLGAAQGFELRHLADGLLAAHASQWNAAILPLASAPVFDRGFVELVTLTARDFLASADSLFALAPIRHLELSEITDVAAELFASPKLARLRSLGLDRAGLLDQHVELLAASPHLGELRWLSIANNEVTFAGAEALAASTGLARLGYVRFYGNPTDPGERQGHDQGVVVDAWLPPEGEALEARHGPIPWLHTNAQTLMDVVPDRFRIAPAIAQTT
jgi:uncharacterized protein (TIGR02996 family)